MSFFPNYSNIYPELRELLDSRAENTNKPISEGGVSGLSVWIRAISSGTPVGSNKEGLVLQSIFKPDNYDIAAEFENTYGTNNSPGIIGRTLTGEVVKIDGDVGRGFRPSPVINNFSIQELQQGALKQTTFTIRCFTIEQVNTVTKYFLEPGFHILLEWGWNVADSYNQRAGSGEGITPCDIAEYNNWSHIKEKRKNSKYQYDASLGIVVGGGIKFGDNETYDVEVKVSGTGQVAEYLQTQNGGNRTDGADDAGPADFEPEKIGKSTPGVALFKQMFNALPDVKKTENVRKWASSTDSNGVNWAYEGNFVNFDEEIREYLSSTLTKGATIRNKSGDKLSIPAETSLFDGERFIRMELAMAIFNSYQLDLDTLETECSGVKTSPLIIDISNTAINAFPHMWSTDKSKLYVPNTQAPNFALKEALVDSDNEEAIKFINFEELGNKQFQANLHPIVDAAPDGDTRAEKNGSADDPATGQSRPVPFAFPCLYDLDESVLSYKCDESVLATEMKAGYWGWLKDLYVNFDFFVETLLKPNLSAKDAMYTLLNGMSSACNSMWNFQLREGPSMSNNLDEKKSDDKGVTVLVVQDDNFTGIIDESKIDGIATYQSTGPKSPFTSFSWDMNVAGAMQSSIMIKKMSNNKVDASGDIQYALYGSVYSDPKTFEDKVGTILNKIKPSDSEPERVQNQEKEKTDVKARSYALFAGKAGIFSRVQNRKGKIDIVENLTDKEKAKKDNGTIESLLCVGTWNDKKAFKAVELIDRGLNSEIPGDMDISDTNRTNPMPGLAKISFNVHGVSGFKIGDMMQFTGIPLNYGLPNWYQVTGVKHDISGMQWSTSIDLQLRTVGTEG